MMNWDSRPQDVLLGAGRTVEFINDVTFAQHQYAVTEPEQFGEFA